MGEGLSGKKLRPDQTEVSKTAYMSEPKEGCDLTVAHLRSHKLSLLIGECTLSRAATVELYATFYHCFYLKG